MKKLSNIISVLLICLLALSSAPMIFGNYASASTGAANFLPNNRVLTVTLPNGSTIPLDTDYEVSISKSVAAYVNSVFSAKYPSSYFNSIDTSVGIYQTVTSHLQTYDNAVVYSKGHRGYSNGHISLVANNGADFFDYDIYTRTSSKNKVTFIWHCETALYYTPGASNTDSLGRAIGMPYAWTHTNSVTKYGTSGTQAYLGWTNKAPEGSYPLPGGSPQYEYRINANYNHSQVAAQFWMYMGPGTGNSKTAIGALNSMSSTIYGTSFGSNPVLYDWLVIYGNQNTALPPP